MGIGNVLSVVPDVVAVGGCGGAASSERTEKFVLSKSIQSNKR